MQDPQDDPFASRLDSDDLRVSIWEELLSAGPVGKIVLGVLGLLIVVGLTFALRPVEWLKADWFASDLELILTGPGVDQLATGMKVVTGKVEIGEVVELLVEDGRPAAKLKVNGSYADQLTTASSFSVKSLNLYVPGNLGVRVESREGEAGSPLKDGSLVSASSPLLPASVPFGSVLLSLGGIVSLFLAGFAARVFKNLLWVVVLVAILLTLILLISKSLLLT